MKLVTIAGCVNVPPSTSHFSDVNVLGTDYFSGKQNHHGRGLCKPSGTIALSSRLGDGEKVQVVVLVFFVVGVCKQWAEEM